MRVNRACAHEGSCSTPHCQCPPADLADQHAFTARVLNLWSTHDLDNDMLSWRVEDATTVFFSVNVNDVFHWGCADNEAITPGNIDMLETTLAEIAPDRDYTRQSAALIVFAARSRKHRVQGAMYRHLPVDVWPLIDAAGPERPLGLGNPQPRPAEPITAPAADA
jgi:hypothetical protein